MRRACFKASALYDWSSHPSESSLVFGNELAAWPRRVIDVAEGAGDLSFRRRSTRGAAQGMRLCERQMMTPQAT